MLVSITSRSAPRETATATIHLLTGLTPETGATVARLMDEYAPVAEWDVSTRQTNEGYIRRTLGPALGDIQLRKLQHRVDILDRFYTHLRRCNALCDGRPYVEHRRTDQLGRVA